MIVQYTRLIPNGKIETILKNLDDCLAIKIITGDSDRDYVEFSNTNRLEDGVRISTEGAMAIVPVASNVILVKRRDK